MSRYFSKITVAVLLCFVLISFGCSTPRPADVDAGAKNDKQAVEKDTQQSEDQSEDQISAEELERQKKLEQQQKEEQMKKEAMAAFENVSIYFAFDSSELSADARATLEKKAEWMRNNPDAVITIEGHCDERGTTEYNLALGERRAESAKKYLTALGIEGSKIKTISYGEERPAVMGSGEEVWSKNRRDAFVIDSGVTY